MTAYKAFALVVFMYWNTQSTVSVGAVGIKSVWQIFAGVFYVVAFLGLLIYFFKTKQKVMSMMGLIGLVSHAVLLMVI